MDPKDFEHFFEDDDKKLWKKFIRNGSLLKKRKAYALEVDESSDSVEIEVNSTKPVKD